MFSLILQHQLQAFKTTLIYYARSVLMSHLTFRRKTGRSSSAAWLVGCEYFAGAAAKRSLFAVNDNNNNNTQRP